jgi:hypothetical protein
MTMTAAGIVFSAILSATGCQSAKPPQAKARQVGWRPIESWTGRGSTQTESFNIESTYWRIKWETRDAASPGQGTFQVVVHSAVSGRPLMEAVMQKGNGSGTAYVAEDPRLYHLEIESAGLNWPIAVEEAVAD